MSYKNEGWWRKLFSIVRENLLALPGAQRKRLSWLLNNKADRDEGRSKIPKSGIRGGGACWKIWERKRKRPARPGVLSEFELEFVVSVPELFLSAFLEFFFDVRRFPVFRIVVEFIEQSQLVFLFCEGDGDRVGATPIRILSYFDMLHLELVRNGGDIRPDLALGQGRERIGPCRQDERQGEQIKRVRLWHGFSLKWEVHKGYLMERQVFKERR